MFLRGAAAVAAMSAATALATPVFVLQDVEIDASITTDNSSPFNTYIYDQQLFDTAGQEGADLGQLFGPFNPGTFTFNFPDLEESGSMVETSTDSSGSPLIPQPGQLLTFSVSTDSGLFSVPVGTSVTFDPLDGVSVLDAMNSAGLLAPPDPDLVSNFESLITTQDIIDTLSDSPLQGEDLGSAQITQYGVTVAPAPEPAMLGMAAVMVTRLLLQRSRSAPRKN
jgi:hypothetical protein